MAMQRSDIEKSIKDKVGASGYSLSGTTATITGNLSEAQFKELVDHCVLTHHAITLISGALTVSSRS